MSLQPDHDLPPDLQQAVRRAAAITDALCPPPHYDAVYWREEREAIARLAVWQAAQAYRERDGVSREVFAVLCAKRAIYREWRRLRTRDKDIIPIPVDEETGEEAEFVDERALAELEEGVLYRQVQEALGHLSERERQLLEWYFGDELSERAIAERLGCSHMSVHRLLRAAWVHLCRDLGVATEFPSCKGRKSPKRG